MTYPLEAGSKGDPNGPGAEAAQIINRQLGRRQAEVLQALGDRKMTADEIGAAIGRSFYVVRPRCSELKALGLVIDTGDRGVSSFGGRCTVYRQTTAQERSDFAARRAAELEKSGATHG